MSASKSRRPKPKTQAVSHSGAYATFLNALGQATQAPIGPANAAAVRKDWSVVIDKASSLLGYQKYLSSARAWKASKKVISPTFERQVQVQAGNAVSDAHDLAAATLRIASQVNQAGGYDHALNGWIAGLKASGPLQIQDLWKGVANDGSTRQMLRNYGVTDNLFESISETMSKMTGSVYVQRGNLAVQAKFAGQEQAQTALIAPTAAGAPTDLSALLQQGQFDQLVRQFTQEGAASIALIPGKPAGLSMPDLALVGSVLAVRGVAQHYRSLQDTGLATYAGNSVIAALIIIGLVVAIIGEVLVKLGCQSAGAQHPNTAECTIGIILAVLGTLAVIVGGGSLVLGGLGIIGSSPNLALAVVVLVLGVPTVEALLNPIGSLQ